jgi:hypothetical protein
MPARTAREYNQGSVLLQGGALDGSREDILTVLHGQGIAYACDQSSTIATAFDYG